MDPLDADLAGLQAQGAADRAPLLWHRAAALAQRRQAHGGPVRQQLDNRLAALVGDLRQRLAAVEPGANWDATATAAASATNATAAALAPTAPRPGPLAALAAADGPTDPAAAPLKAVRLFGGTWARLRIDAQLRRASHRPRGPVGPLNSQRVMLQALQQLRQLSPAYLQHFLAQAETLLWLEDSAAAATPVAATPAAKKTSARRPARR